METATSGNSDSYHFDDVVVDCRNFRILKQSQPKPLTPRAFDVLRYLIEQRGRVVEKQELFERIWQESFVTDYALAREIKEIRRALNDDAAAPRYVETVPKRGYRFIAELQEAAEKPSPVAKNAAPAAAPPPALNPAGDRATHELATIQLSAERREQLTSPAGQGNRRAAIWGSVSLLTLTVLSVGLYLYFRPAPRAESLAVLPFSADPPTEYLADGITESLINNLSRLSELRVTARTTAFSYKGKEKNPRQVGQELNVGTVLTGRVALRDDSLTVQVDLVDAATGTQKWGERYQRKLSDIFAVEEEIGRQIAEKLRLRLSGEEQRQLAKRYTDNAEVYQLYLQGLYLFNKKTEAALLKAIDYFEQAIAKDPPYAPAYPALANCYLMLSAKEGPTKLLPKARMAVTRALEIDHKLAEAHASLGHIKWVYDLDSAGAESELRQALKLSPNSAVVHYVYGRVLTDTGRFDEAHAQAKRAIELDPLSIQYRKSVAYILFLSRRFDEAIAEYRKLIVIAPEFPQAQRELGLAYEQKAMYQDAFDQLQKTYEMPENYGKTMLRADIGHLYAVWGKRTEAQQVLAELIKQSEQSYVSAYDVSVIYAGLGQTEQAFRWLDKAVEQRSFWLCWLKLDPRLDALRTDARFTNLLRRVRETR
jgi:TolB-like protein/DNA-binding winged helix-turn-helix (wHTH) protein/Flp pilus assembly protein TadD